MLSFYRLPKKMQPDDVNQSCKGNSSPDQGQGSTFWYFVAIHSVALVFLKFPPSTQKIQIQEELGFSIASVPPCNLFPNSSNSQQIFQSSTIVPRINVFHSLTKSGQVLRRNMPVIEKKIRYRWRMSFQNSIKTPCPRDKTFSSQESDSIFVCLHKHWANSFIFYPSKTSNPKEKDQEQSVRAIWLIMRMNNWKLTRMACLDPSDEQIECCRSFSIEFTVAIQMETKSSKATKIVVWG